MREALMACAGVKEAKVDYATKTATVIVTKEAADGQKLAAAVDAAGFEGTKVKM